jgi:UDP-3-O-[3-hydroxymyristoyl] glucosamine N-acyltransferase
VIDSINSDTFKKAVPGLSYTFYQGLEPRPLVCLSSLSDLKTFSMVFANSVTQEIFKTLLDCAATLIILPSLEKDLLESVEITKPSILIVDNPRDVFAELAYVFGLISDAKEVKDLSNQSMSLIHSSVQILGNSWIGANVQIGEGSRIYPGAFIASNSVLGMNVTLGPNSSVGYRGFGFAKSNSGKRILFPHIGNVTLKDDVEIGANSTVDSGALGDTIIGSGTKLDNLVHVGHNCVIGDEVILAAGVILCGGVRIEDGAWVAPNACILNNVVIGKGAMVGLGATVIRNVLPGERVAGNPARKLPSN